MFATTPEAPKRFQMSRLRHCTEDTKRRKVGSSPVASCLLSSAFASPPPSVPASPSPLPSSSFASDFSNGSYLSKNYAIIRKLGEGDYGEVKEVQSTHSSQRFALKVSKVDVQKIKSVLKYTREHLKEVRAHSSIPPHPNIVQFHLAWKEDSHVYMLLELCSDSLDGYWKSKNRLTQEDIKAVLNDMLLALRHLSSLKIAHLDVKPANILRAASGQYKLADFSVAADITKDDASSGDIGDGRFAAPELLTGVFTLKADLFSLGVSLIQVATPADEQLTGDEWAAIKEHGKVPDRVVEALTGSLNLVETIQSLIREYASRPSIDEVMAGNHNDVLEHGLEALMNENKSLRESYRRARLSLSSSCERTIRENKSPLALKTGESSGAVFHTNEKFYEMEKPAGHRASLGGKRRPLRF